MPHSLQNSSSAIQREKKEFEPTTGNEGFNKMVNIMVKKV